MPRKLTQFTEENGSKYLAALLLHGSSSKASKETGISEVSVTKWRSQNDFEDKVSQIKEAERLLKLGVAAETAFTSAGFTDAEFQKMLRLADLRVAIRRYEAQSQVEAHKLVKLAATPRKKTSTKVRKVERPGGHIETTVETTETEHSNIGAAIKLYDKTKESSIGLSEEKPIPTGMVPGGRGGLIQNGPGKGRPKGRKSTLTTFLEVGEEVNPDTGETYARDFAKAAFLRAAYDKDYANMVLTAMEKGKAKSNAEQSEAKAIDPALGNMSDLELRLKVIKALESQLNEGAIDTEGREVEDDDEESEAVEA